MARLTKAERSKHVKSLVERGPDFSATFIQLEDAETLGSIPPEQRKALEEWAKRQYRAWASTWVTPHLEDLLP